MLARRRVAVVAAARMILVMVGLESLVVQAAFLEATMPTIAGVAWRVLVAMAPT